MWMGTLPVGVLARRYGRRTALQIGTIAGVLTGLICCAAVLQGSFLLFNIGAVFSGFYAAAHQSYRFAAADTASDAFRPKAISWVLLGGVAGAVVGPQLVIATQGPLAALSLRCELSRPGGARPDLGGGVLTLRQHSQAAAALGRRRRPSAVGDRQAAALHRGGRLRGRGLFDDEPGDDVGAARDGHVQPFDHRCDARPAMARARHVRAELRHRHA